MVWVNGQRQQQVAITDRSFQYGDGGFTTILLIDGQPVHWSMHQARLQHCLQRLAITEPDWQQVRLWLNDAIEQSGHLPGKAGAKIHISRGQGGRGYSSQGIDSCTVMISIFPYPSHYSNWQQQGIALHLCSTQLGLNPLTAGLKHNNRLEQVLIKQELDGLHYAEGVVCDMNQNVIECCAANLFWCRNKVLYSPDVSQAGVNGIMRQLVHKVAPELALSLQIGHFLLSDVLQADEVFITNALHGIVPVNQIQSTSFKIGSQTRFIQKRLNS